MIDVMHHDIVNTISSIYREEGLTLNLLTKLAGNVELTILDGGISLIKNNKVLAYVKEVNNTLQIYGKGKIHIHKNENVVEYIDYGDSVLEISVDVYTNNFECALTEIHQAVTELKSDSDYENLKLPLKQSKIRKLTNSILLENNITCKVSLKGDTVLTFRCLPDELKKKYEKYTLSI